MARQAWLGQGRIPAGYYDDVVLNVPSRDRTVGRIDTLVLVSRCAPRAERIAMLMLLAAELPGFAGSNPPRASGSSTMAPLAREASQFFQTGGASARGSILSVVGQSALARLLGLFGDGSHDPLQRSEGIQSIPVMAD